MEENLIIMIATVAAVLVFCFILLLAFLCFTRYKQNRAEEDRERNSDVILREKRRGSEDLMTGRTIPFANRNSLKDHGVFNPAYRTESAEVDSNFNKGTSDLGTGHNRSKRFSDFAIEKAQTSMHF